jgi:molybdopterin-guanine dinucleotide biosynthesis protein A
MDFDAVILAGGGGRRLGGVDKGSLLVGGMPLLDRVLRASAGARRTVVVGIPRPTIRAAGWTTENPAGGGPVAGLAAGLAALAEPADGVPPLVLVLAVDLVRLDPDDVGRLLAALTDTAEAALFTDADGRVQPLAGLYRVAALRRALNAIEPVSGKAVRLVVQQLAIVTVPDLGAAGDCDTPDQLAAARAQFETTRGETGG